jgi:hypothetical protein
MIFKINALLAGMEDFPKKGIYRHFFNTTVAE